MSDTTRFNRELGESIAESWRAEQFNATRFPDVAATELERAATHVAIDVQDVLEWVIDTSTLPYQADPMSTFGEPALTLFWHPLFRIDLLYWSLGTTAIHEHSFSGAFMLLAGASIESLYAFDVLERVNERFLLGNLRFKSASLLKPGDVHHIVSGDRLIHSVFHLDCPSATLVVRAAMSDRGGPQYVYRAPHVARDPFFEDALLLKKMQTLKLLATTDSARYGAATRRAIETSDLPTAFEIMEDAYRRRKDFPAVWQQAATAMRERFGDRSAQLEAVLRETERQALIISLRQRVRNPDHRFFLALLLNVPDRQSIVDAVLMRYPTADPRTLILQWTTELSGTDLLGVKIDDVNELLLASALDGLEIDGALERLSAVYGRDQVGEQRTALAAHYTRLSSSPVLRSLFVDRNRGADDTLPALTTSNI